MNVRREVTDTAGDRAETLDYQNMAEVVRGVYHFLMEQQTSD